MQPVNSRKAKAITAFLIAFTGLVATITSEGLISGTAAKWAAIIITFIITIASTLGVYEVPNKE